MRIDYLLKLFYNEIAHLQSNQQLNEEKKFRTLDSTKTLSSEYKYTRKKRYITEQHNTEHYRAAMQ